MKKRAQKILVFLLIICGAVTASLYYHNRDVATLTKTLNAIDPLDKKAEATLSAMSLEEKVSQMFLVCFYDGIPSPETMRDEHPGGAVLFAASFEGETPDSVRDSLRAISAACDVKPFIAVDEEGGSVNRVSLFSAFRPQPFKSPRLLFAEGGMDAVIAELRERNALLLDLGINVNLAPVCDITENPNDFMYSRSLGQNAAVTSEYITLASQACLEDNIGFCLKHFPGYADSTDTHMGMSRDNRPFQQLKQKDLPPFEAGIKAGAPAVLFSHNIVSSIDDRHPASLSPSIHAMLRRDMRFDGVAVTDDLSMGAITDFVSGSGNASAALLAVLAGNDMICTGDFNEQRDALLKAVQDGDISEERIDASVRRILKWKHALGLL